MSVRGRSWRGVSALLALGAVLACSALIASARWFWLGEIAASFRWYLGWGTAGLALVVVLLRAYRSALVLACLAGLHVWPELSLSFGREEPGAGRAWSFASANVLFGNQERDGLRDWVAREQPDVLALLELSQGWVARVDELRAVYPHQLVVPEPAAFEKGTWGQALLSRMPFESTRVVELTPPARPILEAVLRLDGRAVTVRAAHPPRPGKPARMRELGYVLGRVAELPWDADDVLLGDLNVASTSPRFGDLLCATGLADSRRGFGRCASWSTDRFVPGLSIAIDHVLVGRGWRVVERRSDALAGSDHRVIVARLVPR